VDLILEYEGHRRRTMGHNDKAIARYRKSIALLQPFFDQQNESVTNARLVIMQPLWRSLTEHSRKRKSIAVANFRDQTYEWPVQRRIGLFWLSLNPKRDDESGSAIRGDCRLLWRSIKRSGSQLIAGAFADMQTLLMLPRE
jgi:hypothetical protein